MRVSYYTGFGAGLGGGEYTRLMRRAPAASVEVVRGLEQLQQALRRRQGVAAEDGTLAADPNQPPDHVIEIDDSGIYTLPLALYLGEGHGLQIRAGQARRPVLRLLDWQVSQADNFFVHGESGSRLVLDGLLVFGRGIQLEGDLASFTLRHSTLVPGWALGPHCDPRRPCEPSIEAIDCAACITIDHSITGSIQVNTDEVTTDPARVRIRDSIVDATAIGSVLFAVEAIKGKRIRLAEGWHDARFGLDTGDFVSVEGPEQRLAAPAPLVRVTRYDGEAVEIDVDTAPGLDAGAGDVVLRRWDHRQRPASAGAGHIAGGAIRIVEGEWIALEDGISIRFEGGEEAAEARYRAGDYWLVTARTEIGDVLWPSDANGPVAVEPHGIDRHLAPLGIVQFDPQGRFGLLRDLRRTIAPLAQ